MLGFAEVHPRFTTLEAIPPCHVISIVPLLYLYFPLFFLPYSYSGYTFIYSIYVYNVITWNPQILPKCYQSGPYFPYFPIVSPHACFLHVPNISKYLSKMFPTFPSDLAWLSATRSPDFPSLFGPRLRHHPLHHDGKLRQHRGHQLQDLRLHRVQLGRRQQNAGERLGDHGLGPGRDFLAVAPRHKIYSKTWWRW